jgi:hypothetical protein
MTAALIAAWPSAAHEFTRGRAENVSPAARTTYTPAGRLVPSRVNACTVAPASRPWCSVATRSAEDVEGR